MLYTEAGVQFVGKDSAYGMKKGEEYTSRDYHQPSDEVKPAWKPGTEFKAKHDSVLKAAGK